MSPLRSRIILILLSASTYPVEFGLSLTAAWWGFWLVLPWNSFGLSTSYTAMRSIGEEWMWGALICSIGLLHLYMVLTDNLRCRRRMAYVSVAMWCFIATMFALGDYRTTGVVTYSMLAIAAGWTAVRLGVKRG